MKSRYPKTYAYLQRFEELLSSRPDRKYYPAESPFYTMRNVADYTFGPYKVVWREQAQRLTVAVVGSFKDNIIVPDHKLMFTSFENVNEAYYLSALLNSSISKFVVHSYSVEIQMGTHVLDNIRIPRFDPTNETHSRLVKLSNEAHKVGREGKQALREIELQIDELASKFWGLTHSELKEIQQSLEELES